MISVNERTFSPRSFRKEIESCREKGPAALEPERLSKGRHFRSKAEGILLMDIQGVMGVMNKSTPSFMMMKIYKK
jgi:hypothetical protein